MDTSAGLSQLLVGIDFSASSRLALARALMIARAAGARVEALHVLKHRRLLNAQDEELALAELDHLVADVVATLPPGEEPPVRARVVTTEGRISETMRAEAAALNVDLVVVGRTGGGVLRGMIIGSTAERFARLDTRPLLVVHPDATPTAPYVRPLVATDFSQASQAGLRQAAVLAPEAKAVDLLHVYDRSYALVLRASAAGADRVARYDEQRRSESSLQMDAFVAQTSGLVREGQTLTPHVVGGDPRADIREQALRLGTDLLVMGRVGTTGASLIGSVSEGVLRIAPCDFVLTGRASPPAA